MHLMLLLAASAAAASGGQGGRGAVPPATSACSDLDLERCTRLSYVEEGESVEWRCPGHAGIPLFVSAGDGRFDVDAGTRNAWFETRPPFNEPGSRVEWRIRGGRGFAIIHRLRLLDGDARGRSVLGVSRIGRDGVPGCLVGWEDGGTRSANRVARELADRTALRFRCGQHRPVEIGLR